MVSDQRGRPDRCATVQCKFGTFTDTGQSSSIERPNGQRSAGHSIELGNQSAGRHPCKLERLQATIGQGEATSGKTLYLMYSWQFCAHHRRLTWATVQHSGLLSDAAPILTELLIRMYRFLHRPIKAHLARQTDIWIQFCGRHNYGCRKPIITVVLTGHRWGTSYRTNLLSMCSERRVVHRSYGFKVAKRNRPFEITEIKY